MNKQHIPTWRTFRNNILLFVVTPVAAYFLFDATGITSWILNAFPAEDWDNSGYPHISRMLHSIFHGGTTHLFACASLHFLYNAISDLRCILTHKHKERDIGENNISYSYKKYFVDTNETVFYNKNWEEIERVREE